MSRISFRALLGWIVLLLAVIACYVGGTPTPSIRQPDDSSIPSTEPPVEPTEEPTSTPLPPTEASSPTPLPPTEAPSPTPIPTETPFFEVQPTAPAARQTTNLSVDVRNLSNYSFEVRANSDLYLSDTSRDGIANQCTIAPLSGSGSGINVTIPISGSATFRVAAGTYKLYCGNRNVYALITSN